MVYMKAPVVILCCVSGILSQFTEEPCVIVEPRSGINLKRRTFTCNEDYLLAPGKEMYSILDNHDRLDKLYSECVGQQECTIPRNAILPGNNDDGILICIPAACFHTTDASGKIVINKESSVKSKEERIDDIDMGVLYSMDNTQLPEIVIKTEDNQFLELIPYHVPIGRTLRVSNGQSKDCVVLGEEIGIKPIVIAGNENEFVISFRPCSAHGKFVLIYTLSESGSHGDGNWEIGKSTYIEGNACHSDSDCQVSSPITGKIIGGSIGGALALVVIVVLILGLILWKSGCLVCPKKAVREAANTPNSERYVEVDRTSGIYSEPYDEPRNTDIIESDEHGYDVIRKDRPLNSQVSSNSLTITENDLYSGTKGRQAALTPKNEPGVTLTAENSSGPYEQLKKTNFIKKVDKSDDLAYDVVRKTDH